MYPTDQVGRSDLAFQLSQIGFKPTQAKRSFDRNKINVMVTAMEDGTFDWKKAAFQPVILGPINEILGGHHRVITAHLAGIDLNSVTGPQVQRLPMNYRPVYNWFDVLPDV